MSDFFSSESRDLKRLEKVFKNGPKIYGRAASVMMNEYAFAMKQKEILFHMQRRTPMEVRNPRFVKRQIRVTKARPRSNMAAIKSIVGSVSGPKNFTGWSEQELGTQTPKTRTATVRGARGGSNKRKMKPSARLRAGKHPRPADFGLHRTGSRSRRSMNKVNLAKAALVWTRREGYKKPWVILGHTRIADGLVKWTGKRLVRLQYFGIPRKAQPKRVKWLRDSRDIYLRGLGSAGMLRIWERSIKHVSGWK